MASDKDRNYILARGFSANGRTTLQHYLYKDELGYLIHPAIPTDSRDLKVAEIGVGTCIWLIELARVLPDTAELDGFDIDFSQCPPKEWLPPNISLIKHNIFAEPPSNVLERYDVIHVQLFITILRDGNPVPMLQNLMKMLKPGGYISWNEWDFTTFDIYRTPSAPSTTNDELVRLQRYISTLGETKPGAGFIPKTWIADLHQTFRDNGLEDVLVDRRKFADPVATLLLDTWMMASQEISESVLDGLGGGRGDTARGIIAEIGHNRDNSTFNIDRVITIGRKPGA